MVGGLRYDKRIFKSIFRTLGRIAAYILLGILAYFIFSWFDNSVDAAGFESHIYNLGVINSNTGYVNYNRQDRQYIFPNNSAYLVSVVPVYGSNNITTISPSSYEIEVIVALYSTTEISTWPNLPTISMAFANNNGSVVGTCDGVSSWAKTQNNGRDGLYYYQEYRYYCSQLDVTQNFNFMSFDITDTYGHNLDINAFNGLDLFRIKFIDLNDMTDTDAIITNNNQNTQEIINNQNNNTTIINESITDIEDILNDDTDADVSILFDIEDYMPSDTPITNLLLLPINLLNASYNGLNGTCQAWEIPMGSFFNNYSLTFPCINLAHRFGNQSGWTWQGFSLWEIIDYMFSIYMIYNLAMLVIAAYTKISSLVDPWEELYIPQHAYVPKHSNYSDYYLGG